MEKETATQNFMKSMYWTELKEGQTDSDIDVHYTLGQAKSLAENSFKLGWDAAMNSLPNSERSVASKDQSGNK